MSARRWLAATVATITLLIVLATVVVVFRPSETAFGPDAPEATVQRYVAAVIDGDAALARTTFGADLAERCPASTFGVRARSALWWGATQRRSDWTVHLLETATLSDGQVRVRVQVQRTLASPPFDVSSATSEHTFVLALEDGAWRIASFDWPSPCF